jgi:DNA repair exonuclease SbcCD ATPase subunit
MNNKWISFASFLILVQLLSGCAFYYKTAQIDEQLKKNITQANDNYNLLSNEVTAIKNEIYLMNCSESYPIIERGNIKLQALENSANNLNSINSKIIKEYENFKSYTSGLDQIASNTEEWKKLKSTKKNVKEEIKNYEKEAENTIKLAAIFKEYITDSILPNVSYFDLANHKEKYRSSLSSLKSQLLKYTEDVKKLESDVTKIIEAKSTEYPEWSTLLKEELLKTKQNYSVLSVIIGTAQEAWGRFNIQTATKDRIYSCSIDWNIITQLESELSEFQRKLTETENAINANNLKIQELILQIGN